MTTAGQRFARPDAASWLALLVEIADRADEIALRYFGASTLRVRDKQDGSPVSEADHEIERMARTHVEGRAPGLGILGEEEGETAAPEGRRIIIDPIDGTRNFVRGIPIFASLLAIEDGGCIVAGLVSAPALASRWWAAKGSGAFKDGKRLSVSDISQLSRAHLFHADLSGRSETAPPDAMRAIFRQVERTRGFGDFYQHMLVAEGAGEIAIDPKVKPWDVAAVKIVVEEAGGRSTSFLGDEGIHAGTLLSTNGRLHDSIVASMTG